MSAKKFNKILELLKKNYFLVALIFLFFYSLSSVKTIFFEGMIPGWDHPVHYVHAYRTNVYMLPKLKILSWDPFNQFGWVFNQYYNPGMSIFVSSVYRLFLNLVDFLTAYKIAFFLAYFLLAPAVFFFIHALTGDKVAALLSAFFSITTFVEESDWFDAGLKQMYYIGMWPERLGLVFAFFSMALLAYAFNSKSLRRFLLFTALGSLTFSITVLTHVMMGISAVFMSILLWLFISIGFLKEFLSRKGQQRLPSFLKEETVLLVKFAFIGLLSIGMAAFWMVPLFQTLHTYHSFPAITWSAGPWIFGEIFNSIPWYIIIFYFIGVFSFLFIKKRLLFYPSIASSSVTLFLQIISLANLYDGYIGLRLLSASVTSIILLISSNDLFVSFSLASISLLGFLSTGPGTYFISLGPIGINLLEIIPFARNFGYSKFSAPIRVLIFSLSAIGFSRLSNKLYSLSKTSKFSIVYSAVIGLLAFLIINLSINAQVQNTDLIYPWSRNKVFKLTADYQGFNKVDGLIDLVKNNVPVNTYILFQDTLDLGDNVNFATSHYIYIASLILNRPIVGGCFGTNYITNPYANSEGGYLLSLSIDNLLSDDTLLPGLMDELGIGYISVYDKRLIIALNSSNCFKLEYYDGLYAVFRKLNFTNIVSIDGSGLVDSVSFDLDRIEIKVTGVSNNASYLMVRQVNFPGFTAEVDGRNIEIETYYPKLPSVIINWHWVPTVYNLRIPFIKVKLPSNAERIVLTFNINTVGDTVSKVSWVIFLCLLISPTALFIAEKLVKKWRK